MKSQNPNDELVAQVQIAEMLNAKVSLIFVTFQHLSVYAYISPTMAGFLMGDRTPKLAIDNS